MSVQHGLSQETVANISKVFARFPNVERVVLYGSRANGTARSGSDIDLVLFGNEVDRKTVDRIADALDDLLLPYQFDLSIFAKISHADLLDHSQRVGVLFYEKAAVWHSDLIVWLPGCRQFRLNKVLDQPLGISGICTTVGALGITVTALPRSSGSPHEQAAIITACPGWKK